MQDARCKMQTPCAGFSKTGARYRVPGSGYLAPGTRYRISAEGRTPSTEDRARPPENAHTGFASCILHPVSCILHLVFCILYPVPNRYSGGKAMKPHSRPYLGLIFCSLLVVGSLMGMGGTESALSRTPFHPNLLRASIPALRYARPGPLIIRPAQSGVSRPASWVAEHWTELVPAPSEAERQLHEKLAEMLPLPIPREKLRPHYKPSSAPVPRPPASSPQPAVPAPRREGPLRV
jgi:hypothetical protein